MGRRDNGLVRGRTRNLVKFRLERLLLRGTLVRLMLIGALIVVVSVTAGLFVQAVDHGFEDPFEAIWWAFLRLTDPGYLGDDHGPIRRTVSTVVTMLGYVVFLGALVAILTQWLNKTINDLESGYTPIAINGHVLVLGWTSRHRTILRELLQAEGRVERFLERHDADRLVVVVMVPQLGAGLRFEVQQYLGELYSDAKVIFRSGNPLRIDHLRRVDFLNAAAIILPSDDLTGDAASAADTRTIKALLSMAKHAGGDALPQVVTEMLDLRKVSVGEHAYRGPAEILASDLLVGCMLAQSVLHEGLSDVFAELMMEHDGCMLRICTDQRVVGRRFGELPALFPRAVVIGLSRPRDHTYAPHLVPPPDTMVRDGDALVLVARTHDDVIPHMPAERPVLAPVEAKAAARPRSQRVLILGWSSHVPAIVRELAAHGRVDSHVVVASVVTPAERQELLASYERDLSEIDVVHRVVDYTVSSGMNGLEPETFDQIVIVQSDWAGTDEEGDARTVVGYLMLREALRRPAAEGRAAPRIIVELGEPSNAELLDAPDVEVLVTPLIVGQLLAQVALRPELNAVYAEMLGVGGAEMASEPVGRFGLEETSASFSRLSVEVSRHGAILIGLVRRDGRGGYRPVLSPLDRHQKIGPLDEHRLVVLVRPDEP